MYLTLNNIAQAHPPHCSLAAAGGLCEGQMGHHDRVAPNGPCVPQCMLRASEKGPLMAMITKHPNHRYLCIVFCHHFINHNLMVGLCMWDRTCGTGHASFQKWYSSTPFVVAYHSGFKLRLQKRIRIFEFGVFTAMWAKHCTQ